MCPSFVSEQAELFLTFIIFPQLRAKKINRFFQPSDPLLKRGRSRDAQGLIERGLTAAGRISISGGSAGGELMGAVANSDPGLWGAVVAHVPFVDVLATMLDASLPLTPGGWPDWGNPIEDKSAFDLIRSYSP